MHESKAVFTDYAQLQKFSAPCNLAWILDFHEWSRLISKRSFQGKSCSHSLIMPLVMRTFLAFAYNLVELVAEFLPF